jgi:poly-gamma-glutamate capsule biosynthesis protein CapA/YwtB (metallophosphatase superfamily)
MRYAALGFGALLLLAGGFFLYRTVAGERVLEYVAERVPVRQKAEILFVGDMFFDRQIRQVAERKGEEYLFSCVAAFFEGADFVVGNLEGPLTEHASVSAGTVPGSPDNFRFTFPTSTATLLARHHVGAVNIGNNHIDNFGAEGIASTRELLSKAGVLFFGGLAGDETVARAEVKGFPLSFVSYNEFGGSSPEDVAETISDERAAGRIVILYAHWGDEYTDDVTRVRPLAELFVEHGASAVIGSHPHVIQENGMIGDAPVYYSLGNFIFDQYFDERVSHGLAVELSVSGEGITAREYPVVLLRDGRTCLE